MSGVITENKFQVHYSQIDYFKRAKITTIVDFFNDMAVYQSEKLGIGLEYLNDNGFGWIILKWDINIIKMPKYLDEIIVKTQPVGKRKIFAYRKFEITDIHGNLMVEAKSIWSLVNIKGLVPVKIPEQVSNKYNLKESNDIGNKIKDSSNFEDTSKSISIRIRYGDIDTNGHVNNEKYIAWIIESMSKEVIMQYNLKKLKISYKKETKYGENIQVLINEEIKDDRIICLHKIINEAQEVLTLAETQWERN
ncbi:acyl-[acyl-carrier-protein] thioesterase [Clostridium grantii]|uniref:Medium-chain acyl-[acyl-carrier-protein] hydrolase n=1 Tax=Clostridium grantii DSM 8605 TaxID=1121316 RepID=A0A1M5XHN3_9CLOT|nr:acyl-ACP thioesterase domain-containing protein [Clostridium grantii]SHH98763.1 medium-chain acyl-[acyl-carrier-protein] hydrolase [Clostridium grantii DSM 8605]